MSQRGSEPSDLGCWGSLLFCLFVLKYIFFYAPRMSLGLRAHGRREFMSSYLVCSSTLRCANLPRKSVLLFLQAIFLGWFPTWWNRPIPACARDTIVPHIHQYYIHLHGSNPSSSKRVARPIPRRVHPLPCFLSLIDPPSPSTQPQRFPLRAGSRGQTTSCASPSRSSSSSCASCTGLSSPAGTSGTPSAQ